MKMVNLMNDTENLSLQLEEPEKETEYTFSEEKNKIVGKTLYLVATPIGNLSDISQRAVKVLSEVDFIAAEDTRNTLRLLSCLGISKSVISYYEYNKAQKGEYILRRLKEGESCALVTDAGTPAISDPGEDIVRLCAENDINVTAVPGCCAAITALSISALSTSRFLFEGFLKGTKSEKKKRLEDLSLERATIILYEAPHRLKDTLELIYECFGERKIALCRELTKLNEQVIRTTVSGAVKLYNESEPRGEYVLVIDGAVENIKDAFWKDMSIREHVDYYVRLGYEKMAAIKLAAKDRGVGKNSIYKELIDK